jgi:hypothetical protein
MSSFIWPAAGGGSSALEAPCLFATAATAPTGTLSGSYNLITFDTKTIDPLDGYSTTTGLYTTPSAGIYYVHAFVRISHTSTAANQIVSLRFLRSGTALPGTVGTMVIPTTGVTAGMTVSHSALMNITVAGQTIRAESYTEGGSPAYVTGSIYHGFMIYKVRDA